MQTFVGQKVPDVIQVIIITKSSTVVLENPPVFKSTDKTSYFVLNENECKYSNELQTPKLKKLNNWKYDKADVKLVKAQTQSTKGQAINALIKHHGDLLSAILEIMDLKKANEIENQENELNDIEDLDNTNICDEKKVNNEKSSKHVCLLESPEDEKCDHMCIKTKNLNNEDNISVSANISNEENENNTSASASVNTSDEENEVDAADLKLVMAQTQTTKKRASKALKKHPHDILGAILEVNL